jgi:ribose transport system ATP-binding protein
VSDRPPFAATGAGGDAAGPDLRIRGLTKSFGSNRVLHGIDLEIAAGEFVGLIGPNGAGKSTLIKILDGVYGGDGGEIAFGGQKVRHLAALRQVAFIHQDLGLIEDMSIAANLRLGERPMRLVGPVLARSRERAAAEEALLRIGLDVPVDTLVSALSPGEKTLVAVARALQRGAQLLFVDEATSTLPAGESARVIAALRHSADAGTTVVMVTHKLSEILEGTERVVLLLDGLIAADMSSADLDRDGLVRLLATREGFDDAGAAEVREYGEPLLVLDDARGGKAGPLQLTLRGGEIIGLTGLPGSGLHDVAYLAAGHMQPTAGRVVRGPGVDVGFVPPHRESQGGFLDLSVAENMTLSSMRRWRAPGGLIKKARERRDVGGMIDALHIKPADPLALFGTLSGGNKQKGIFGRVLLKSPQVYVLCEPTRGIDISTRTEIYRLISNLRDGDAAVLVVSSDAQDLFAVCDRVGVVEDGRIRHTSAVSDLDEQAMEAFV